MGAAALIIAYSSVTMFRKALKAPKVPRGAGAGAADAAAKEAAAEDRAAAIERAHAEAPTIGWREAAIGAAIGLFAGLASGYVGVGGGFIMVPLMMSILHVPMKLTSGTSLIAVMIPVPGTVTKRCSATSTGSPASPWPAAPSPEQPWARSSSRRCPSASCASCSPASSWWPSCCREPARGLGLRSFPGVPKFVYWRQLWRRSGGTIMAKRESGTVSTRGIGVPKFNQEMLAATIAALAGITLVWTFSQPEFPVPVLIAAGAVFTVSIVMVIRLMMDPDSVRALQSDAMLQLASSMIDAMGDGLTEEASQEVCEAPASEHLGHRGRPHQRERARLCRLPEAHNPACLAIRTSATHECIRRGRRSCC